MTKIFLIHECCHLASVSPLIPVCVWTHLHRCRHPEVGVYQLHQEGMADTANMGLESDLIRVSLNHHLGSIQEQILLPSLLSLLGGLSVCDAQN